MENSRSDSDGKKPSQTLLSQPQRVLIVRNTVSQLNASSTGTKQPQCVQVFQISKTNLSQPQKVFKGENINPGRLSDSQVSKQSVRQPRAQLQLNAGPAGPKQLIPKQHPLDCDLKRAKAIFDSVKQQQTLIETNNHGSPSQQSAKIPQPLKIVVNQPKTKLPHLPVSSAHSSQTNLKQHPDKSKAICKSATSKSFSLDDEDDLSEEEFMPKKKSDIKRESSDVSKNSSRAENCVKKKPVKCLKEDEVKREVARIEEESIKNDDFIKVHDMMPSSASYVVTACKSFDEGEWCATIRGTIETKNDAELWLSEYERENSVDFRFRKSVNVENSGRLVFKREYRCHHNTMPRKCTDENVVKGMRSKNFISKNTNCPAFIRITIKQKSMKRSSDILLKKYPCEIVVSHNHNHPIKCANAVRRRRPCQAIHQKFKDLLQRGLSPLAALQCHKLDLELEYGEDVYQVSSDRSLCPSNFWVYKLAKKLCVKEYGPQTGEEMIESLKKYCDKFNEECNSECIKFDKVDGEHLVVVICTPLMKRASRLLKSASEMLFADSSGTMDCLNCKLFLLQTPSVAGALPLGAIIVTSESENVLNVALAIWKTLLPGDAFFGRGATVGPRVVMTDDCSSERNAFKGAFETCILLLCLFHILQAFWRFIWNREQNVVMADRSELFFLFRDIVYAADEESFNERLKYAQDSEKFKKYPKVLEHMQKLVPRAAEWALWYRKDLLTRGNNTDNYSEAGIKVFKEQVLGRCKAYNPVHLLDFVVTRYDKYLKRRITDVVNNVASNVFKSRFYVRPEKLDTLVCKKLELHPNTYLVSNTYKGTEYTVIMDLEICSCPAGQSGAPCKHLSAVVKTFNVTSSVVHPLLQCHNPSIKLLLFEVAYGHRNVPEHWFDDLHEFNAHKETPQGTDDISLTDATGFPEDTTSMEKDQGSLQNATAQVVSEEALSCVESSLDQILSRYKKVLREKPGEFLDAFKVFVSQNEKLSNSETGLISALHTFGKNQGTPAIGFHSRRRTAGVIPVQPTARARRTVYIGGKRAQCTGRPPKSAVNFQKGDHTYGNAPKRRASPAEPAWNVLPKRVKVPAPHSLQHCVVNSQMVGANHSRK